MANFKEELKSWKKVRPKEGKKEKKQQKHDRVRFVFDLIPELTDFYIFKGHHGDQKETVAKVWEMMSEEAFPKAVKKILKTEDETPVDVRFATVIAGLLDNNAATLSEEVVALYSDVLNKLLKDRIKEVVKASEVSEEVARALLMVVPDKDAIIKTKVLHILVGQTTRKMYKIAKDAEIGIDSTKKYRKLFRAIFGKERMTEIAVLILLEQKRFTQHFNESQFSVWNGLTMFALEEIEKLGKKDAKVAIESYVKHRADDEKKGRDGARRYQLTNIKEDDLPILHKIVTTMAEKDKDAKYL